VVPTLAVPSGKVLRLGPVSPRVDSHFVWTHPMIAQLVTASWRLASRLTVSFKGMLLTRWSVPQRLALVAYRLPGRADRDFLPFHQCASQRTAPPRYLAGACCSRGIASCPAKPQRLMGSLREPKGISSHSITELHGALQWVVRTSRCLKPRTTDHPSRPITDYVPATQPGVPPTSQAAADDSHRLWPLQVGLHAKWGAVWADFL